MSTKPEQNTNNIPPGQLEQALARLSEIKPNITSKDREDAIKELGYSAFTVVQYLTGKGKRLATAVELLQFFNGRVKERAAMLEQS